MLGVNLKVVSVENLPEIEPCNSSSSSTSYVEKRAKTIFKKVKRINYTMENRKVNFLKVQRLTIPQKIIFWDSLKHILRVTECVESTQNCYVC